MCQFFTKKLFKNINLGMGHGALVLSAASRREVLGIGHGETALLVGLARPRRLR
jgi:hypothetical protein